MRSSASSLLDAVPAPALPDDPLVLPPAWTPPARPPLPIVAAIVPVVGAVGLWLVTGSVYTLWFALLGPLIAAATLLDARRAARRDGRRAAADAAKARQEVTEAVASRHERERSQLWARHPDVARMVTREGDIWRGGRVAAIVVGEGERPSAVRVTGGEGDPDAAALRRSAVRVTGAPVTVPIDAGLVVVGSDVVAGAVQRALVLQLCTALAPGDLRLVGALGADVGWAEALPHRAARTGMGLAVIGPGDLVPAEADLVIARSRPGDPLPPRCQAVLTVMAPGVAQLEHAGDVIPLRVEAVALVQAEAIAADLSARAERTLGLTRRVGEPVLLGPLLAVMPPALDTASDGRGGLPAVIGMAGNDPATVDLVADGPHAVVAGVTGSGKSELLITWILSLCATRSPDDVTFLLADFKGGTAFDGLAGVPHVTGVITDLDGSGARRAIESLRAELRRREATIAAAGARDILDPRVRLARLVVVVDEFAALLADHPELNGLFADVAARGRALGIHLILGTQRAAGVFRDNLLANCPLRISLRVTDPADSRALLGTDDAARLPGGAAGRGAAFVRRAGDITPQQVRIALSGPDDVATAALQVGSREPSRPWLPELPRRLGLGELAARASQAGEELAPSAMLLGLADEPERQRQPLVAVSPGDRAILVLGGPASGVSNVLDLLEVQAQGQAEGSVRGPGRVVRVPRDPEGAWDAVAALHERPPAAGTVVLFDDLDGVALAFPPEYAQVVLERVERVVRRAGDAGILLVAGAHRVTGAVARVAELFPRRLLLPYPTRIDHAAAGGDATAFDPSAPPGRGRLERRVLQVASAPERPPASSSPAPVWLPTARLTGVVARRSPASRRALAAWDEAGARVLGIDEYVAAPTQSVPDATAHAAPGVQPGPGALSVSGVLAMPGAPVASVAPGVPTDRPVVVVGEPDDWQRHWRLLSDVRGDHDLVIDTSCAAELRVLGGFRGVPPYCEPGRPRGWLISSGDEPVRILLPGDEDVMGSEPHERPGNGLPTT